MNKVRKKQKQQPYFQSFFFSCICNEDMKEKMFELVVRRRQAVRGGEVTELLLDTCKLGFD